MFSEVYIIRESYDFKYITYNSMTSKLLTQPHYVNRDVHQLLEGVDIFKNDHVVGVGAGGFKTFHYKSLGKTYRDGWPKNGE